MHAITMTTDAQQLLLLLTWMSPAFPIGGFAYSHGLELAIDDRQVADAATLRQWIDDCTDARQRLERRGAVRALLG